MHEHAKQGARQQFHRRLAGGVTWACEWANIGWGGACRPRAHGTRALTRAGIRQGARLAGRNAAIATR
jgi:hypothetical protein